MAQPINPNLTPAQLALYNQLATTLKNMGLDADKFTKAINQAGAKLPDVAQELQGMEGYVDAVTSATQKFNTSLTDSLDLAQGIVDSLDKQGGAIRRATKAMSSLVSLGQQLVYEDQKLDALSERQLEKMTKEARLRKTELEANVNTIAQTLDKAAIAGKIVKKEAEYNALQAVGFQNLTKSEKKQQQILENELEILKAYTDSLDPYGEIIKHVEKRYKLEQATTKAFGLTGVALSAASTVASKMGMGHISNQLDDIDNKLRNEIREAIELNDGKALGFGKRFMFAAKGAGQTGAAIAKGMLDPLYLMGKIYSAFLDVNKQSVELSRLSGQNGDAMAGANFALATTVDFLKVAGELTLQMGLNAQNVFSADVMAGAAELKNTMGLSAEEAGGLALMAQTGGKNIKDMSTNMVSVVSSFNKSNRSAVSQGIALKTAANASDSIKLSVGNSDKALAKAAASATRLGLSLQEVDNIAASLVDFESSISNELEAELLIGKDLNLEKARELALSNDLAGVGDEIFKNSADAAEFGKMNRIQQEAYAKSLGLTRDQMGKIAYIKALEAGMTEEQAAAAGDVEASDMRRMAIQEKMALVMDKIFQAFSPILDIALLILDPLAQMLGYLGGAIGWVVKLATKFEAVKWIVVGIAAAFAGTSIASFFGTAIKGSVALYDSMKQLLSGGIAGKLKALGDAFTAAKGGGVAETLKETAVEKVQEVAGGGVTDTLKEKAQEKVEGLVGDKTDALADKVMGNAEEVPEEKVQAKGGFKDNMKNLADGLKKMGASGVVQGIANLALAGPALVLALPSIPFIMFMGKADLSKLSPNFKALSTGIKSMAGTMVGSLALALAGPALVLALPSIPFLLFMGKADLKGLQANFKGLATGLTAMSGTLLGSLSLGAFGVAAIAALPSIPFLLFMGKVDLKGLTKNFTALATGLTAMSGTMLGSLSLGAFAVAGALALVSIPFLLFMGKVDLTSLTTNLTGLAIGLTAMSGTLLGSLALGAFAVAGALAIPSLIFLGGIALIGAAASAGLIALGVGLASLGAAAATGLPFIAVGLIAALGLSMIPFAIAANVAAEGFAKLIDSVSMDNIGALLLLGPALMGVAAGLSAIGLAGIVSIPGIAGLAALSIAAPALTTLANAIGMGGESKNTEGANSAGGSESVGQAKGKADEGSLAAVAAKLDALIAVVKAGGDVYMDSNKVGRAQVLGSYKSA